ncbi:Alpha/Beta hydrolase protein [Lasiosphaeria hispida]|uniref:Alpha/Beta hydrolase protein n=1 Tax=Lasiosphaeria hispida TaxID=260671 RepID=A0AAJ0MLA3_9PEZI|nr:Alpha/Beta hydrolase protein [Lasiosphaeria hispida]
MSGWDIWPSPPGQERRYPSPTKTGTVLFRIPGTGEVCETYFELWGDLASKQTPLICLHGGPGIIHDYLLPISLIHTDYDVPVLMYDQVGCGKSTRLRERKGSAAFWTPALFTAELDNLITTLDIATFDLLGHSWGGMLAAQYATAQPAGLRKLVVCDSPADMATWVSVTDALREQLPPEVGSVLDACEREGRTESPEYQAALIEFYRRHLCRVEPFPRELMAVFAAVADDNTVYTTMNGPSEFAVTGSLASWSIVGQLHTITEATAPGGILIVNGHFDEVQDACVLPYFTHTKARVKWVQFALSAHMPQLEETEKFVRTVGSFLTTHASVPVA